MLKISMKSRRLYGSLIIKKTEIKGRKREEEIQMTIAAQREEKCRNPKRTYNAIFVRGNFQGRSILIDTLIMCI